jgi:Na+-transporting NADH:ubiquinone oxidoreductase subunit C
MSETAGRTLTVATVLCGVCSVLVAGAVVVLKPTQDKNREIDFKKNILMSAGLLMPGIDVEKAFEQVDSVVVNLHTGEIVDDIDPNVFDQDKADRDPEYIEMIDRRKDIAGIKRRAKYQKVYLVKKHGEIDQLVLHVYGKGLWSTMKGFLSLDRDTVTVRGFNYYSHAETPGLGGEIDHPRWIAQWPGKRVYDENMQPAINVIKGLVDPADPKSEYKIDGLSGATLTSVGVENTFQFWMSDIGYGKFLANFRSEVSNEN